MRANSFSFGPLFAILAAGCASSTQPDWAPPPGLRATQLSVGETYSCARLENGTVRCWGRGSSTTLNRPGGAPQQVGSTLTDAESLQVGTSHACARRAGGAVVCWGSDAPLGDAAGTHTSWVMDPVSVQGLPATSALGLGLDLSCALGTDALVRCWGDGRSGELGTGSLTPHTTPGPAVMLDNAVELAVGSAHGCARRGDGSVWCWGDNRYGQVGDGTRTNRLSPVRVAGLDGALQLSVGSYHSCALRAGGSVWCWGQNEGNVLRTGMPTDDPTPREVAQVPDAASFVTGGYTTCVVQNSGRVWCWGDAVSQWVELTPAANGAPTQVPWLSGIRTVSVGQEHVCVLRTQGAVQCWGGNQYSELGDGTSAGRTLPFTVRWQ